MIKVRSVILSLLTIALLILSIPLLGACSDKTLKIATCENGFIVMHTDVIWAESVGIMDKDPDFYEAVGAEGYYFEKWIFLDKKENEIATFDANSTYFGMCNMLDVSFAKSYMNTYKAKYIKAIFTNDESKLVDVTEPTLKIDNIDTAPVFQTNLLPDKKVVGTRLIKFYIFENAEIEKHYYVFEPRQGEGFGNFLEVINNRTNKNSIAWFDDQENETFGLVDSIQLFLIFA